MSEESSNFLMGKTSSRIPPSELHDLTRRTNFGEEELQSWYDSFIRDYPEGRLNVDQFKDLYTRFYQTSDAQKFAEHVFRTFDTNKDGTIDFREFICSLSVTTRGTLDEKLRWAFSIYDIDGNGYITKRELLCIVRSIQRMVGSLEDIDISEDKLLQIFKTFDTDRDGRLSLDEFLRGVQEDPTFMRMLQGHTE